MSITARTRIDAKGSSKEKEGTRFLSLTEREGAVLSPLKEEEPKFREMGRGFILHFEQPLNSLKERI